MTYYLSLGGVVLRTLNEKKLEEFIETLFEMSLNKKILYTQLIVDTVELMENENNTEINEDITQGFRATLAYLQKSKGPEYDPLNRLNPNKMFNPTSNDKH